MSRQRVKKVRAPRAAFAIDAVLTRSGAIDIRRQYFGPKNVEPSDLINLVSGVVAVWLHTAFRDSELRRAATDTLLNSISSRLSDECVTKIIDDAEEIPSA